MGDDYREIGTLTMVIFGKISITGCFCAPVETDQTTLPLTEHPAEGGALMSTHEIKR